MHPNHIGFLYRFSILLFFIFLPISSLPTALNNNIVITLMVKNEANNIVQTLQPFIQANISSFLIYDTGSIDTTIEVVSQYLQQHNVSYTIIQEPFVDFAYSRNKALDYTRTFFQHTDFILMPDAEWYLQNANSLVSFCNQQAYVQSKHDCFLIKITDGNIQFYVPRLFRTHASISFTGVVHEIPKQAATCRVDPHAFFYFKPSTKGKQKSRARWHRDKELLKKAYKKDPRNPRTTFYLAQTYASLGNWHEAYYYYKKRVNQNGNTEENYLAWYKLAQIVERLAIHDNRDYWHEAVTYYLRAHELRPLRAEPLYAIAHHYFYYGTTTHELEWAYFFAHQAYLSPYPLSDVMFIQRDLYTKKRFELYDKITLTRNRMMNQQSSII